jgi:hypothetical protein
VNPLLDKVPPANPDSARQSGTVTAAEEEVGPSEAHEPLPAPTRFTKGGVAVNADEGPLGPFAQTLDLRQEPSSRVFVVRQPRLGVTMTDHHLSDANGKSARTELEGIQPQSSGLPRKRRRYDHAGDDGQIFGVVRALVYSASRQKKHPRRRIPRRAACFPDVIAIDDAPQADTDELGLATGQSQ